MRISAISTILFLLIIIFPAPVYTAFEQITGGSARPMGMAEAFVAIAEGGENALLNPAGLGFLKDKINLSTLYSSIFTGLDDGSIYKASINAASSLGKYGGIALNGQFLGVDIEAVEDIYKEYLGIFSYGKSINNVFSLGCNLKYFSWKSSSLPDSTGYNEEFKVNAFSFDIACLYRLAKTTSVGLMICDFTQPVISSSMAKDKYKERVPINVRFGMTFGIEEILFAFEGEAKQRKVNFRTGAERYFFNDMVGFRMGFQFWNIIRGINFTTGMGFKMNELFQVDYSFLYPLATIRSTSGTHRVSATFKF